MSKYEEILIGAEEPLHEVAGVFEKAFGLRFRPSRVEPHEVNAAVGRNGLGLFPDDLTDLQDEYTPVNYADYRYCLEVRNKDRSFIGADRMARRILEVVERVGRWKAAWMNGDALVAKYAPEEGILWGGVQPQGPVLTPEPKVAGDLVPRFLSGERQFRSDWLRRPDVHVVPIPLPPPPHDPDEYPPDHHPYSAISTTARGAGFDRLWACRTDPGQTHAPIQVLSSYSEACIEHLQELWGHDLLVVCPDGSAASLVTTAGYVLIGGTSRGFYGGFLTGQGSDVRDKRDFVEYARRNADTMPWLIHVADQFAGGV